MGEASDWSAMRQTASQSRDHIGCIYDNINIILCTIEHYEQLVKVTERIGYSYLFMMEEGDTMFLTMLLADSTSV